MDSGDGVDCSIFEYTSTFEKTRVHYEYMYSSTSICSSIPVHKAIFAIKRLFISTIQNNFVPCTDCQNRHKLNKPMHISIIWKLLNQNIRVIETFEYEYEYEYWESRVRQHKNRYCTRELHHRCIVLFLPTRCHQYARILDSVPNS